MVQKSEEADLVKRLDVLDMSFEVKAPTTEDQLPHPMLDPATIAKMLKNLEHAEIMKKLVTKLQSKVLILELEVRKLKEQ
jgi:hypothetical protein